MKTALLSAAAILACLGCGRTRSEPPSDPLPEAAPPYAGYPRVRASDSRSCLLREDGQVECWGSGGSPIDALPDPADRFADIDIENYSGCGIRRDASVICWPGERGTWGTPLDFPDGRFRKVSMSGSNACAVQTDGPLTCWGHPDFAITDPPGGRFLEVAIGTAGQACAVRVDGRLACWGETARARRARQKDPSSA